MICYFCNKPNVHKYCCNEHRCFQFMDRGEIHFQFDSICNPTTDGDNNIIIHLWLDVKYSKLDYYCSNSGLNVFSTTFDPKMNKLELFDLCAKTIPLKLKKSSHFI